MIGTYEPSKDPHFLWVTEFPLFTRADDDKEFLARGRWSSTHHPFTAPMAEDVEKLLNGEIKSVSYRFFFSEEWASGSGALDDIVRPLHLGRNRAKG